eukprot:Nitzschia sp. Nitz4//scaffold108_size72880//4270//5157//NITZ4_005806-RA/size72880-processed-gene-0.56-mRNA-1//1//CDS//3329532642//6847//frame0
MAATITPPETSLGVSSRPEEKVTACGASTCSSTSSSSGSESPESGPQGVLRPTSYSVPKNELLEKVTPLQLLQGNGVSVALICLVASVLASFFPPLRFFSTHLLRIGVLGLAVLVVDDATLPTSTPTQWTIDKFHINRQRRMEVLNSWRALAVQEHSSIHPPRPRTTRVQFVAGTKFRRLPRPMTHRQKLNFCRNRFLPLGGSTSFAPRPRASTIPESSSATRTPMPTIQNENELEPNLVKPPQDDDTPVNCENSYENVPFTPKPLSVSDEKESAIARIRRLQRQPLSLQPSNRQ